MLLPDVVVGVPTVREIFNDKYYVDLEGGILESFGRLFKNDLKFYAYPQQDTSSSALVTSLGRPKSARSKSRPSSNPISREIEFALLV